MACAPQLVLSAHKALHVVNDAVDVNGEAEVLKPVAVLRARLIEQGSRGL